MGYKTYVDKAGEWRWNYKASNGRTIADSGEGYRNKSDCLHAINIMKNSGDDPID